MHRSGPMVAVCLAPTDLRPEVDDLTGAVRADLRRADLAPSEAAALEHALRLAEAWDGWVLAVASGPVEIDPVLQQVSALGAEVVRLDTGAHAGAGAHSGAGSPGHPAHTGPESPPGPRPVPAHDMAGHPGRVAAALAAAIRARGNPAAVLCGDRSGGLGVGAVPALLAHELGLDQALGLVSVTVDGPGRLLVERRLDGGWRERLAVDGPAVLSVEGAGIRLRRAGLAAALGTDPGPVPSEPVGAPAGGTGDLRVSPARPYRPRTHPVPPPEGPPHERLLALTGALSTREPARVVGPVDAGHAVEELLSYLRRFGYID